MTNTPSPPPLGVFMCAACVGGSVQDVFKHRFHRCKDCGYTRCSHHHKTHKEWHAKAEAVAR